MLRYGLAAAAAFFIFADRAGAQEDNRPYIETHGGFRSYDPFNNPANDAAFSSPERNNVFERLTPEQGPSDTSVSDVPEHDSDDTIVVTAERQFDTERNSSFVDNTLAERGITVITNQNNEGRGQWEHIRPEDVEGWRGVDFTAGSHRGESGGFLSLQAKRNPGIRGGWRFDSLF